MKLSEKGTFIISLDFEMTWGGVGVWDKTSYTKSNVSNVRQAIIQMLELFKKYEVKATFATVGLLMLKDKNEAMKHTPELNPSYCNKSLSPFEGHYLENIGDESLYFAPDIISLLKKYDNIEIGTHTYSHYFCWEKGQTIEEFESDIKKAVEVAKENGLELKSIVFPRNQVSAEYLQVCKKYGVVSYRGNAQRFYNQTSSKFEIYYNKIARFLDSYINYGGRPSYKMKESEDKVFPIDLRASRFLRPYNKRLSILENLKIKHICRELEYAAKHGEVYHLWWHPHNFGINLSENLKELETILQHYSICRDKYGMQTCTMADCSIL